MKLPPLNKTPHQTKHGNKIGEAHKTAKLHSSSITPCINTNEQLENDRMKNIILVIAASIFAIGGTAAFAHSGGTDPYGCHMDHSTGVRHCH